MSLKCCRQLTICPSPVFCKPNAACDCRTKTGYVTRLLLEAGLRQHCRHALAPVPATDLLDLLEAHAAGIHISQFKLKRTYSACMKAVHSSSPIRDIHASNDILYHKKQGLHWTSLCPACIGSSAQQVHMCIQQRLNGNGKQWQTGLHIACVCAGHSDKFVRYKTFLYALELLLVQKQAGQVCAVQVCQNALTANTS